MAELGTLPSFADRFWSRAPGPETEDMPEPLRSTTVVNNFLTALDALEAGGGKKTPVLVAMLRRAEVEGDLSYASPEQLRGESLDARSIVFSLGVVLFERLTGRHPFGAENNRPRRIDRIRRGELGSGVNSFPTIPAGLRLVLVRAMSPFAEERWTDLQELRSALRQAKEEASAPRLPMPGATRRADSDDPTRVLRNATDFGSELMNVVDEHDKPEPQAPKPRAARATPGRGLPAIRPPAPTPKPAPSPGPSRTIEVTAEAFTPEPAPLPIAPLPTAPPPVTTTSGSTAAPAAPAAKPSPAPPMPAAPPGYAAAPASVAAAMRNEEPVFAFSRTPSADPPQLTLSRGIHPGVLAGGGALVGAVLTLILVFAMRKSDDAPSSPTSDPAAVATEGGGDPGGAAAGAAGATQDASTLTVVPIVVDAAPPAPPKAAAATIDDALGAAVKPCLAATPPTRVFGMSIMFKGSTAGKAYYNANDSLTKAERACISAAVRGLTAADAPAAGDVIFTVRVEATGMRIRHRALR